ncbi:MAG: ATP-binding protein [Bacillota bacterium]|nr:ATP-binding protein [Bacillota bacterium]
MREISLHILDIVQNSIAAGARTVDVSISEDEHTDTLTIEVADDGAGIPPDILQSVLDPFYTTRTTRKIGLGLPLFREAARAAGGDLDIESSPGRGTRVQATFKTSHIDRAPLGDMAETVALLVVCNPDVRFRYRHTRGTLGFSFDSAEFRRMLGDIPPTSPALAVVLKEVIREGLAPVQRA